MPSSSSTNELPTREELARLPRACIVAYATRSALRAVPILGRNGTFDGMWRERIKQNGEAVVRAVQLGLTVCTAGREISATVPAVVAVAVARAVAAAGDAAAATKTAAATAASARAPAALVGSYAVDAASAADDAVFAAVYAASHASEFASRAADAAMAATTAATRDDLAFFLMRGAIGSDPEFRVPLEFFHRPLWLDETMTIQSARWLAAFQSALQGVGLTWAAEEFPRWTRGDFESEAMARDLEAWPKGRHENNASTDEPPSRPSESSPESAQSVVPQAELLPPLRERGVETRLGNDGTEGLDALDRTRLAKILAEFLRDKRTQTPLTLSIEGRWGSGKTRFMKLLRAELETPAAAAPPSKAPPTLRTVWFNPWRHQSHEELWAAFALTVLEESRRHLSWFARARADLRLGWACLDQRRFWRSAAMMFAKVAAAVALIVLFASFAHAGWKPATVLEKMQSVEFWRDFIGLPVGLSASAIALMQAGLWLWKGMGGHLRHELEIHLDRPSYAARTSFLAEFHRDFARAVSIYSGGQPLVVFIDDLDRCDVPRAAELMQGINLMLGENAPLIYVLGMDRAKVAAGIAVKHRELLPFLYARELAGTKKENETQELRTRGLEYGYEFIEKFIQLPFRLPPSGPEELRHFIRSRLTQPANGAKGPQSPQVSPQRTGSQTLPSATDAGQAELKSPEAESAAARANASSESTLPLPSDTEKPTSPPPSERAVEIVLGDESHLEEPLLHAASVLDGNPRRIAQLVNLVRLQRRLAPALGLKVQDGQLAKWTAVALRWPVFLIELEQSRGLLADLVKKTDPTPRTPHYDRWNAEAELVSCLRDRGPAGQDPADYDLTAPGVVSALLRLGITVPVAEVGAVASAAPASEATKA